MRLRNTSFLILTLAAGACGTSAEDNANESVEEAKKADAGRNCRPATPGEPSACGKGSSNHGGGQGDAGKGRSDADDDDDDDREDGGKK